MFNRQIGDAFSRIELIGGGEGIRRADGEAARATAAMIRLRLIRWQLDRRKDGAQKQPAAMLARNQHRVFALPTEACRRCQGLFHYGGGVDKHFNCWN